MSTLRINLDAAVYCCWLTCLTLLAMAAVSLGEKTGHVNLPEATETRPYLRYERPLYRNYGYDHYQPYGEDNWAIRKIGGSIGITERVSRPAALWSPLGDHFAYGFDLFTWVERRQPDQRFGSALFKDWSGWQQVFTNVVVASDGYGDWGYSAVVGDGLSARLSPLTLSKTDLNGARFDLSLPAVKFTALASRISKPNRESYDVAENTGEVNQNNVNMLQGGRAQSNFGALSVGLNGANLYGYTSTLPANSIKGSLRNDQPLYEYIMVRVIDDDPADGRGGAVVQEVRLIVNGESRPDLKPRVLGHRANAKSHVGRTFGGNFIPITYNLFIAAGINRDRRLGFDSYYQRDLPKYADYLYRIAHDEGVDVSGNARVEGLLANFRLLPPNTIHHADGAEQLIYVFDMRNEQSAHAVEVELLIGNDYRVDWSGLFIREGQQRTPELENRFQSTYYQVTARAKGRVDDLSNLERVRFGVGENTGIFTYSADFHLELPWLEVTGEYARSAVYGRYPVAIDRRPPYGPNPRFSEHGSAYYLNGIHRWGRAKLGGELFSMDRGFKTEMISYLPQDFGYRTSRGYSPFADLVNDTVVWRLVQDNDDADRWPDVLSGNVLGSPLNRFGADYDGIFPNQDLDQDGVIDVDKNVNGIPDYNESFLRYEVEPNDYVYGLDRNHNDDPDHREDDWEVDYPYDSDQRGHHLFVQIELTKHWSTGAGRFASNSVAGGGHNRSTYALLNYRRTGGKKVRHLFFENHLQRVQDDIRDEYTVFKGSGFIDIDAYTQQFEGSFKRQSGRLVGREDLLFYQDSYVNELYLEGVLAPWKRLLFEQKLRARCNWQKGGELSNGLFQQKRRLDFWTYVGRVELPFAWGDFGIAPQFKYLHLLLRDQEFDQNLRKEYQIVPILRMTYPIMRKTTIRAGFQGWGPIPFRVRNGTQSREDLEHRVFSLTVSNVSRYFGYDLYTIVGMTRDKLEFEDPFRRDEEVDGIEFFVRALIGFTEFGRLM